MPNPQPNNPVFNNGGNPEAVEKDNSLSSQFLENLQNLYETSKDGLSDLLYCPGGQRRGWKILDGDSAVEFVPCGCYDDALWPLLLGIPAAAKGAGKLAAKTLTKKARKKFTKEAIEKSKEGIESLKGSYYRALKGIGSNTHLLRRKRPPVQPGYTRLYRGQGARKLQKKTNPNLDLDFPPELDPDNPNFNNDPLGHYWTDDEGYADRFSRTDSGLHTNDSQIFYVDIPTAEAEKFKLGRGQRNGTEYDLEMLPGQKYGEEVGGIIWDPSIGEYVWPPHVKMPLRRRNLLINPPTDGWIEIVIDTPDPKRDIGLNPDVFAANQKSAGFEYYLDSPLYGTNYLEGLNRQANLYSESAALAFQGLKQRVQEIMDLQSQLDDLLSNPSTPNDVLQDMISKTENAASNLKDLTNTLFDTYEGTGDRYATDLKALADASFGWSNYLKTFVPYFLGLLAFIDGIMNTVSIVKDKSCIPLMEGGISELSDKSAMAQVRNQRIANKQSVWAELDPESCECNQCPSGWNFCNQSSMTNLYMRTTNSCIPPCCGDQEFKPITLIESCKCDCPDGKVFMPCDCSDCTQSDSLLTSIISPSKPGKCVDVNPDPSKLEWNPSSCSWECKTTESSSSSWIWVINPEPKKPPCKEGAVRQPPGCECSGSYSISPCEPESTGLSFNIFSATDIKLST